MAGVNGQTGISPVRWPACQLAVFFPASINWHSAVMLLPHAGFQSQLIFWWIYVNISN